MKAGLWPTCEALIISCILLYSSNVEARLMRFNPNGIHPPQQPTHHNNKEVGMRKSRTMMNKEIPVLPVENKLPSPLKETLQGSVGPNHSGGIKEAETEAGGTQLLPNRPSVSQKGSAKMKKDVEVMAFRPTSSGHSPGVGHGNPPDLMV